MAITVPTSEFADIETQGDTLDVSITVADGNNDLIALIGWDDRVTVISTVSDGTTNFTEIITHVRSGLKGSAAIYYLPSANVSSGANTITCTLTNTDAKMGMAVLEVAGATVAATAHKEVSAEGVHTAIPPTNPPDAGDLVPTVDDCLLVMVGGTNSSTNWSATLLWNLVTNESAVAGCEYRILTGGADTSFDTAMALDSNENWSACAAAFVPAAAAGVAPTAHLRGALFGPLTGSI